MIERRSIIEPDRRLSDRMPGPAASGQGREMTNWADCGPSGLWRGTRAEGGNGLPAQRGNGGRQRAAIGTAGGREGLWRIANGGRNLRKGQALLAVLVRCQGFRSLAVAVPRFLRGGTAPIRPMRHDVRNRHLLRQQQQ